MLYLLDTNAVSDAVGEQPKLCSRLRSLNPDDTVATCVVVNGESLFGIERLPPGKRRQELEAKINRYYMILNCYEIPIDAAAIYARTKRGCQRKGLPLDENDLWIAATAIALGATLVTRDGDFQNVDGLKVENWAI